MLIINQNKNIIITMSSKKICYLIVRPNLEIKNSMEMFGFDFFGYSDSDDKTATLCSFPDGWDYENHPSYTRIYLPYTSKEFIIPFNVYVMDYKEGESFNFPYEQNVIYEELLSYGFEPCSIIQTTQLLFPGKIFNFIDLIIPKGWHIHTVLYFTYLTIQIYDPNNILKYNIKS